MIETVINKIQGHADEKVADGYFSLTNELLEPINSFRKHKIIDWEDFIKMTNYFIVQMKIVLFYIIYILPYLFEIVR